MIRPPVEASSGLAAVLRGVIADFQHVSGAELVSIFLFDESSHTYYAPFATGQPQESLLDSLTDMHEQLARYLADEKQGKVPEELGVHQYGSTVWLTVTRQRLVARNAPAEIDSTFIRRYQVQSTIGLPLLVGDRLFGLIYLNYRNKEKAPDDGHLRELDRRAATAAGLIQDALEGAEHSALDGLSRLTSLLTTPVGDARTDARELRRLLSIALADLLMASNLDGAAIYQFAHQRSHLELVTAHLRTAAPTRVDRADASSSWEKALEKTVGEATAESDLHPVATYALGKHSEVPEFDFNFATVYLLDEREDGATVVRMAAGAATAAAIESGLPAPAGKKVPRWAQEENRLLAEQDVLVYVARSWQPTIVGPMPSNEHADVIAGGIPVALTWTKVPVVYGNGMVKGEVLACLIGEKAHTGDQPPFTLAGEVFERGGHKAAARRAARAGRRREQGDRELDRPRPDADACRAEHGAPG